MSADQLGIDCPGCRKRLRAPASAAGKKLRCPNCKTVVTAPPPPAEEIFEAEVAPPVAAPVPVAAAAASADPFDFFAGEPAPTTTEVPDGPAPTFFTAVEPRNLLPNRVYQIHADSDRLVGLYIGSAADMGAALGGQFGLLGGLVAGAMDARTAAKNKKRQDAMAGRSFDDLLDVDDNHFALDAADITAADVSAPSLWFSTSHGNVPQIAVLSVETADGTKRRFAFASDVDVKAGLPLLQAVLGDTVKVKVVWDRGRKKYVGRK